MTKPIKYTATGSDGTVHTRKSPRTYTHVVLTSGNEDGPLGVFGWCGRPDLAEKKAAEARRWGKQRVEIVPAIAG